MSIFQYIQMKLREFRKPSPDIDLKVEELKKLGWFTEQETENEYEYSPAPVNPSLNIRIVDDRDVVEPIIQTPEIQKTPEEKVTLENMSPETKRLLYEFLSYPTSDYMGLGNLLATYDTESKLITYLSSRVGLKRAKRRSYYD